MAAATPTRLAKNYPLEKGLFRDEAAAYPALGGSELNYKVSREGARSRLLLSVKLYPDGDKPRLYRSREAPWIYIGGITLEVSDLQAGATVVSRFLHECGSEIEVNDATISLFDCAEGGSQGIIMRVDALVVHQTGFYSSHTTSCNGQRPFRGQDGAARKR